MQGISDPQTFQLSEIVQKSSKSGIFTNKRLLMIKDGFLYYFSKVPSDYKGHEPNLMSSLKELPKSSIEIRSIQSVKLESAKSSTLILTFNNRDMIDRQDIRKSLSSKNYNHPVKPTSQDLEQWKFIFATVMKCRLWYASLVKLKQFFVKSQDKYDKFAEYMANFDPQIRSSLPQFTSKSPSASTNRISTPNIVLSPNNNSTLANPVQAQETSKYKMNKQAGIFEIQQSNEQYDEQITPKMKENLMKAKKDERKQFNPSEDIPIMNIIEPKKPTQQKEKQTKLQLAVEQKKEKIESKNIRQQKNNQKQTPLFKSWDQPKIQIHQAKEEKKNILIPVQIFQNKTATLNEPKTEQKKKTDHLSNTPKVPQKKIQQIQDIIRLQQKKKAEQQAKKLNKQLEEKQATIRKMADEIEANRKAKQLAEQKMMKEMQLREEQQRLRKRLQRQKREQDQYRRLRESIQSNITSVQQPSRERSVTKQNDYPSQQQQKEFLQVIQGHSKQQQTTKFSRYSFKSDLSMNPLSNQRDTLNLFRNTISYISEVKIDNRDDIESYDFCWQIGQIYKSNDLKERISKELQLAQFVRKASRKVQDLIVHYIDLNRPKQSIKIDRSFFQIEIVCERGRIIRTQGSEQLIYPNENHQRLKRTFKIYNQLNQSIIKILKKKPNFPLRVPFSCLVEYKGYTAFAKIAPSIKQKSVNAHQLKLLQNVFPIYNLKLSDFETHGIILSLVQPLALFKVTKEDESSIYKYSEKYSDFLMSNRKANISICSKKLFEEVKEANSTSVDEKQSIAEMVNFCRDIKKVMKANTPYLEDNNEFQFFEDFLKQPQIFMGQLIPQQRQKITGILLHFIQQILGIRIKTKFKVEEETSYFALATKRKYDLLALDVYQFSNNFEKYISQQKFDIAEKSLNYFKQLQEDYSLVLMRQVNFHLHQKQFTNALQKLQLCQQMVGIHHPNRLNILKLKSQCFQAIGEISKSITTLKELLEETQYMFGQSCNRIVDIYFMIADLLSRQGLIPELIQVYRKILKQNKSYRQKVLMDFCRNLLKQDTDPHILLDFLQKEMPESIDLKIPQVQQFYGQLYFKMKNKPKALSFFNHALEQYIQSIKPVLNLYEIISRTIECCSTLNQKKVYHRNIISKLSSIRIPPQECRQINTYISCLISNQSLNSNERDTLIAIIEDTQANPSQKLLEWNWLESILKRIARCQQFDKAERSILLASIDANIFSENLILLNNPNFI